MFLRKRNLIHPPCPIHKSLDPLALPPNLQRPQIPTRQSSDRLPSPLMVPCRLHHRPPSMPSDLSELEQRADWYLHQPKTILLRQRDIQSPH